MDHIEAVSGSSVRSACPVVTDLPICPQLGKYSKETDRSSIDTVSSFRPMLSQSYTPMLSSSLEVVKTLASRSASANSLLPHVIQLVAKKPSYVQVGREVSEFAACSEAMYLLRQAFPLALDTAFEGSRSEYKLTATLVILEYNKDIISMALVLWRTAEMKTHFAGEVCVSGGREGP